MASISSAGIGSGLDVSSIVTQLMSVEKAPLQQMQTEATKIQNKLSAYGKIQSFVSSLRDAAASLTKAATWGDNTAASGDASVLTATTDTGASAGSYSMTVQQLASAQTLASPASAFPIGAGRLRIELGAWATGQTGFTPKSGSTGIDVSIDANDTPAQVRDKINAAKAGVMASVVTDATGSRLVLRSTETGKENAFRITEVVTDAAGVESTTNSGGLAKLTFNPPGAVAGTTMTETLAAANAEATINGLAVSTASNVMTGVVEGVTIKLGKVSSTPVDLTVSSNTEAIKKAVTTFTDAYNSLNKYLADQTKYDSVSKQGATLQGDSGTNSLRSAMRNIMGSTGSLSGAFQRLSQVGISPQADGSLSVDSAKLTSALGKLSDVKALFATSDAATDSGNGFARRMQTWSDNLLSFDGSLTTRSSSLQRQIVANTKKQEVFNDRLTTVEARMRAQYTALDTQMAKLNNLSSYMTQQITNMNKSTA